MDPISIGASILTVLGAAATTAQTLEKLCSLRHAPDDLVALINEVSDMQVVLSNAQQVIYGHLQTAQSCGNLNQIVDRASKKIAELNDLIYHDLVKKGTAQGGGITLKVSRKAFLRHAGKIRSLKLDVRDVKLNLLFAVAMLTCVDVSRLRVQISHIEVVDSRESENTCDKINPESDKGSTRLPDCQELQLPTKTQEPTSTTIEARKYSNSKPDSLYNPASALAVHTEKYIKPCSPGSLVALAENEDVKGFQVRVKASVLPMNGCDRICPCRCHHIERFTSPASLTPIIGRLFVGYTGLPLLNRRSCDRISCQRGNRQIHVQIAYLFPIWFFLRLITLTITQVSSTFALRLKVPVITRSISPNFVYASLGRIDAIQAILCTSTASLNTIDAIGSKTPLHVALQFLEVDMASFLIQQGAEIDIPDCNNKTPLDTYYENYFTAVEGNRMTELLPLFERYDVLDHWNLKNIHLIILGRSRIDLLTYLNISHEPIDVADSLGRTALMWAAWRGDSSSVSTLLKFGANCQATSLDGNSVLVYATYGGSLECLTLLLNAGADVNHTSHSPLTPSIRGRITHGNFEIAKALLQKGAACEANGHQTYSPLYAAALTNKLELLIYILDRGASVDMRSWDCATPLSLSLSWNNHRMIEQLIRRGCSLTQASSFQTSYLHIVALMADEETIQIVMREQPAINVSLRDSQGFTARDHMARRLSSMDSADPRKMRLATLFQQLVDVCITEYQKTQSSQFMEHSS